MIKTEALTKSYGGTIALRELDLEVRKGEVFGLLGPNGSGKTTMIRLILGLLRATSGQALVVGHDSWRDSLKVRDLVAYLPGELRMFGSMTGLTLLKFLSSLRGGIPLARAVEFSTGYFATAPVLTRSEIASMPFLISLRILSNVAYFVGRALSGEDTIDPLTSRVATYLKRVQWLDTNGPALVAALLQLGGHA